MLNSSGYLPRNGPDRIRTRTCDLDGVLCFRYTTGPQFGLSGI